MINISREKLIELIKDEEMATREYHSLGLHNLEKDEHKHATYLKKMLKAKG